MKKRILCLLLIFVLAFSLVAQARSGKDTERARSFERYYGLLPDEKTQQRIADLGEKLVVANGLSQYDFTFRVINSSEVNAVTLPGGYIYVYKGLIDFMPSDEEIAAVIGHEMGHVMGNHFARREREQWLTLLVGALLGGPEGAIAANAALASLPAYGQRDEREADDSGFKYLTEAGMNPYAMLVVMHKLGETENSQIRSNFAAHPEPLVRAGRINKYIEKMQVKPTVMESTTSALVQDGSWSFSVTQPDGENRPLYRAWLLAGNLYCISRGVDLSKDKFIVVEQKDSAQIYYADRLVYTVGQMDVLQQNQTASQKAAEYIESFRGWVDMKKQQPVAEKSQ